MKREYHSRVFFDGKIAIIGGELMEAPVFSDGIAKNVVLIDLEEQTVKVLPPSEKNGDFQCTLSTSVCYWKDSKIIAFGGMRRSGEGMSTVRMITLDAESKILKRLDYG